MRIKPLVKIKALQSGPQGLAGDVAGPSSNTDEYIPQWDGLNSKTLKNGVEKSTDVTLAGNSDDAIPTEKAVKTYVDLELTDKEDIANKDTTITLGASDTKYPSQKAVKTYVDTEITNIQRGVTPYIHLGMSANQTVDNGTTVAFDTLMSSNVITRSGNGVNVQAGNTYRLQAYIDIANATSPYYLGCRFYDNTTAIGEVFFTGQPADTTRGFKSPGFMYYTPDADSIIYVKVTVDSIGTGYLESSWNSSFIVEEVTGMKGDKGDTGTVNVSDITFEGWTAPTFQNSWVNFGSGWAAVGYCKDSLGFVHLKGLIKSGTVAYGTPMFTLPVGYRPAESEIFASVSNSVFGEIAVDSNGIVSAVNGSNSFFTLSGITFKAA